MYWYIGCGIACTDSVCTEVEGKEPGEVSAQLTACVVRSFVKGNQSLLSNIGNIPTGVQVADATSVVSKSVSACFM